tara:strand:+ start:6699 stop:7193 length:495 start_codon:yes stop_codon:yes gene_type:complete
MEKQVIDDFLDEEYFNELRDLVMGSGFMWMYQDAVGTHADDRVGEFYFVHSLYNGTQCEKESPMFNKIVPLLNALDMKSLVRARFLMYVNQGKQVVHESHQDTLFPHNAALLYLNTNDGYTGFDDGTKVQSVANRLVVFDGTQWHHSTTCTDEKTRCVIAVNYF